VEKESLDLSWKKDVMEIFSYYTERTPGSSIEEKQASVTWHYRQADPIFGSWQAKECHNHLENNFTNIPAEIMVGKKNIEVRPKAINKGEIVRRLAKEFHEAEFVYCTGDDKTDEDMFRAFKDSPGPWCVTIGPGSKKTMAGNIHLVDNTRLHVILISPKGGIFLHHLI